MMIQLVPSTVSGFSNGNALRRQFENSPRSDWAQRPKVFLEHGHECECNVVVPGPGNDLDAHRKPGRAFFDASCGSFHEIEALSPVAFFAGRDIAFLIGRQAAVRIAAGLGLGFLASGLSTRFIAGQLWKVSPTDPAVFAGVGVLLALVVVIACVIPTYRAIRVNPTEALRTE